MLSVWVNPVWSKAELIPVGTFEEMKKIIEGLGEDNIKHTLIVMDDDDTLTMMKCNNPKSLKHCQYLGGPAWYAWQSSLVPPLKNKDGSEPSKTDKKIAKKYRVADTQEKLLNISALLLAMNNMPLTEQSIPNVLGGLTKKGAKVLVLTARGVSNVSATERQFSLLRPFPSEKGSFLTSIKRHALIDKKSGIASMASPITPVSCQASRSIAYQQGVMYVAGQNKGHMLKCLLERTDSSHIKNIVFIDDTLANSEDVFTSFEQSKTYNVKSLHYTLLFKHKLALTKESNNQAVNKYQKRAHNRWLAIKKVLSEQLISPATKQEEK